MAVLQSGESLMHSYSYTFMCPTQGINKAYLDITVNHAGVFVWLYVCFWSCRTWWA